MENENRGPSQLWHGWIASSIHIYRGSQNIIDIWSDKHGKWKQRTLSTLTALSFLGKLGSWETTRFLVRKFSPTPPQNEMSSLVSSLDNILHLHPTPIRDNLVVSFETCLHPQTRQSRLSHLNQWCSNVTLGGSTATSWEARAAKVHSTPHTMPHPYISIEGVRTLGAVHILRYTILASFWPIPH